VVCYVLCVLSAKYARSLANARPVGNPPLCACGCGQHTKWLVKKNKWGTFVGRHNTRNGHNGCGYWNLRVDWSNPLWWYLLGAHFGDGCDHRRLDIAVGKDEPGWADALVEIMKALGLKPHVGKTIRVRASSPPVMHELAQWKPGGREGLWVFPRVPAYPLDFLAGLVDSDGSIGSTGGILIFQRDNGNLERLETVLRGMGETRLHLGRDVRTKHPVIDGRELPIGTSVRLGLRGTLRDELAPHLRNPNRIQAWDEYRARVRSSKKDYKHRSV
jgi:hypothetical protein